MFTPPISPKGAAVIRRGNVIRYELEYPRGIRARWEIRVEPKSIKMGVGWSAPQAAVLKAPPGILFTFDLDPTPVAPLANPRPGAAAPLPCLLHAADYGSLLLRRTDGGDGALEGRPYRAERRWDALVGPSAPRRPDGFCVLRPVPPDGRWTCRSRA